MGYFYGLIVSALSEQPEGIDCKTEAIEFSNPTYVSWEIDDPQSNTYEKKASKTIFIKKGVEDWNCSNYEHDSTITPFTIGTINKKMVYEFSTSRHGYKKAIYHLLLPELYTPINNAFSIFPDWEKKSGKRLVLTWAFEDELKIKFRFEKVEDEAFNRYPSKGNPIDYKIDPETKAKIKEDLFEAGYNVAAKCLLELLRARN